MATIEMKLIGLMSLDVYKEQIRNVFSDNQVQIYSEVEMAGHTAETIKEFGWWHQNRDQPLYSTLYFAIVPEEKAEQVLKAVSVFSDGNPQHPPRAFVVNVEKMI